MDGLGAKRRSGPRLKAGVTGGVRSFHGLDDVEALEIRAAEVAVAVLAGILVCLAEGLRLGPALEGFARAPHGVRGIERVVLALRSLQQVELDEARQVAQ